MVELMAYGLTGLAAMLVVAFCFTCSDELPQTREQPSYGLIIDAHANDSPLIETGARCLRFRGDFGKQHETAPASLGQKTLRVETGRGAIYRGSSRNNRETPEAFHG
jgi:hypothetical protein